ncbi:protein DJ-1 homolog D-like [Arachis hypogaea]|uniref:protein DJ-1 homolog D-like n=1 Tax=Arachis hypogaea TaxID=3818 RepID=UPI003B215EB5
MLDLISIEVSNQTVSPGQIDYAETSIDAANYDRVMLLGGRAPEYLAHDPLVALVIKFFSSGKTLASICLGQLILAVAGVVKDHKFTAFSPAKPAPVVSGAHWVEPDTMATTVVNGNLITAHL